MEKVTGLKLPPIGYWLLAAAGSEPVARHENSDGYAAYASQCRRSMKAARPHQKIEFNTVRFR
jgi:hypothetical protein